MFRIIFSIWILILSSSLVWAINEDTSGFQMDTNMSEASPPKQNDSTLRFLQALTNQQEEIQNLNLLLQQEKRNSKIESENLNHRMSFGTFLLWGILAINGVLLFIVIIMGLRLKSFSKQINGFQAEIDAIQTEIKALPIDSEMDTPSPKITFKNQKKVPQHLFLSPSDEKELDGFLASEPDKTILSDHDGQNFFKKFQNEIDRERLQLNNSGKSETEKSENDLLDELIEQHFSDSDRVTISSKT